MTTARVTLGALGLAAIGYGIVGTLTDSGTHPLNQLLFLLGVLIGHDLLVLPVALAAGTVAAHWVPGWARGPLQAALFASAVVFVVALPLVIGAGRTADNPSAHPLNYPRGLLLVLAAIWTVAALAAVRRRAATSRGHVA